MCTFRRRDLLKLFPKFEFIIYLRRLYVEYKKMRFPLKLAIGCGVLLVLAVAIGFIGFPKMIKSKVKKMVTLAEDSDVRKMFVKVPFGLTFKVYLFNVTNPMDVQNGKMPHVQEIGPFCYEEWKEKVDVSDNNADDTMAYKAKDTFIKKMWPGCLAGDEVVTIAHPMILGMVNAVIRAKPGMLTLINKAITSVYRNPESIFLTDTANNILFDGVIINCDVQDFAGKAVCTQLKTEATDLRRVSENELAFSLMAPKNGTPSKEFRVLRGVRNSPDVGRVVEFDGKKDIDKWPTEECNRFDGTDGTIFAPLMRRDLGLASFAPDLCRSLVAKYSTSTKYSGIPVNVFTASLGDMSSNPEEKCYCPTPDTCLKKGVMDLFQCAGVPIYVSLPHFYDSDISYLNGVVGLNPKEEEHGIRILFEQMTGSPVAAEKRLQFSMPLQPNEKVGLFNNLPNTVLPMFWLEESVHLNETFTKPLKSLFGMLKIVKFGKWILLVASIVGLLSAIYLMLRKSGEADITPVKPQQNSISTIHGNENSAMDMPNNAKY